LNRRKRPTLKTVSAVAGVSPSTVSLVVQGKGNLPDATRKRVLQAIEQTGYQRPATKQRSSPNGNAVGIIGEDIKNPYYSELVDAVSDALSERAMYPVLVSSQGDVERQDFLLRQLYELGVCGIILIPANGSADKTLDLINELDVPIVLGVRHLGFGSFDYVGPNYYLGMQLATRHLIELGHKRIAFVGGEPDNTAYSDRVAAFRMSLETAGLRAFANLEIPGPPTSEFGFEILPNVVKMKKPPTGIIAYNDITAFGLMAAVRDMGRVPGQDISIIGFDDIREASRSSVPLTTVSTPPDRVGRELGSLLLSRIKNPSAEPVNIIPPPKLMVRASCCAPSEKG
jgi:LacI family transcriptional regulator